jgi:HD superfamily phosphohydrolase
MAKEVPKGEDQLDLHGATRTESSGSSALDPLPGRSSGPESVGPLDTPMKAGRTSRKADRQEFFLPVSGFVWLFPEEVLIVNHPAFQRLGRIYQLGQSYLVFRGATHKRIEHVIGAVHVVQRMIAAVETNSEKISGNSHGAPPLSDAETCFVRLGTLLHDIGHLAAGHTVEDELELVSKHDGDRRLDMIFDGEAWRDRDGQTLGKLIDKTYDQFVPTELKSAGITPSEIVRLLVRKPPQGQDDHSRSADVLRQSSSIRLQICRDMIGNTICADLLDYIHRDWYHVGKGRPFDERLLQYMEVRNGLNTHTGWSPKPTDRFVISLGSRPKIRTDAVSNILDLLDWRYSLAEAVLFHRTKLAATAMLDRALYELWGGVDNEDEIVQFLLPLSDEEMLSRCRERAESVLKGSKVDKTIRERMATAAHLLGALERRELFSHLSTRFAGDLPGDRIVAIKATYARDPQHPKRPAKNRNSVLRTLEQDFGLPHGSLGMYCPSGMNRKIAEVQIAVGGEIERFCDYEQKHDRPLAGGHLDAQLRRFDRLWRVHFFIDRRVRETMGDRLLLLQQAIDKLALGNLVDDESGERVAMSLAKWLTQTDGSPWKGYNTSSTPLSAKSDASTAPEEYPTGAPSVRAFFYK